MLSLERLAHEVVTRWERGDFAEALRALDWLLQEIAEDRERRRGLIERAVDLYADDDIEIIEIDADRTFIAASQEGTFVMAWLWVAKREDECAPLEAHADAAMGPQEGAQPQ